MPSVTHFELVLTRGGGAELYDKDRDQLVWSSDQDEEFQEEFEEFLTDEDIADILDYLVDIEELTEQEADRCEIEEEYYSPEDVSGSF